MSDVEDIYELDLTKIVMSKAALSEPQQILLVGEAGNGKTHTALTASRVAGLGPVLVLDTEGSTVGVVNNFPDVDVVRIENYAQLNQLLESLLSKTHKYKTVIIDTLDSAAELALKNFEKKNPNDGYAKWGMLKDWLTLSAANGGMLHRLKAAPFLSILISHTREEKSDSGAITNKVNLQGSGKNEVPSIPDAVFFLTRVMKQVEGEKDKRPVTTITTVGTRAFTLAKNRFQLPPQIVDGDLTTVYDLIRSKNTENQED